MCTHISYMTLARLFIHAFSSSSLSKMAGTIAGAIRTKRAFFLPVDHTPRNLERSRRCQDELDTRVEPYARPVGSINGVVRYISHPAAPFGAHPDTLFTRGVQRRGGHSMLPQSPPMNLHATGSCPYPTGLPTARFTCRQKTQQPTIPSGSRSPEVTGAAVPRGLQPQWSERDASIRDFASRLESQTAVCVA